MHCLRTALNLVGDVRFGERVIEQSGLEDCNVESKDLHSKSTTSKRSESQFEFVSHKNQVGLLTLGALFLRSFCGLFATRNVP